MVFSDKARKRKKRRQEKQEKAKRLAEKLLPEGSEVHLQRTIPSSKNLSNPVSKTDRELAIKKLPKFIEKPSIYNEKMTWCPSMADVEGSWDWGEERRWSEDEWTNEILRELDPLRDITWSQIAQFETGEGKRGKKRRKRHHPQEISTINQDARARWSEIGLELFDTAYRFRLGGTKRAWGLQYGSHFYLVWYERHHMIYPTA